MTIDRAWERVKGAAGDAGAIRIDASHPADFFAARDGEGHFGLIVVLEAAPPKPPRLEALDITIGERADGRWALSVYLTTPVLLAPFTQLCQDLIDSSRGLPVDKTGQFVVARLHRWLDLLEKASLGMSLSKLRGLIGELLLLRSAMNSIGPADAVNGWAGPYSAPQDFALPGLWIEVKATYPTARSVRITSADQLSAPGALYLAVFTLTSLLPHEQGTTARGLAAELFERLKAPELEEVVSAFSKRLSAVGFNPGSDYATLPFREEAVHFYRVLDGFPRITPSALPAGIVEVMYDVELGALPPFETVSPI